MNKFIKNICVSLLVFLMILMPIIPSYAYAEEVLQQPSTWALSELVDVQAMDLLLDDYSTTIQNDLNEEQLANLVELTADKLSLLNLEKKEQTNNNEITTELTRENLINILYNELDKYVLPDDFYGDSKNAQQFMQTNGIVKGYTDGSLKLEQDCTVQEAMIIAERFVSTVYNKLDEASGGLLWKAENNGNTVYLFGSVHVDRGNIYPFDQSVMDALLSSQEVSFEIDFMNQEGMDYFTKAQMYDDETTLNDHISPELYEGIKPIMNSIGLADDSFNVYRPWALAGTLSSLMVNPDMQNGKAPMIIDIYMYSKALYEGKIIKEVEGYKYQADLFNGLSEDTQEEYLKSSYNEYMKFINGDAEAEDAENGLAVIDSYLDAVKKGDEEGFSKVYDKDEGLSSDNEFTNMLFTERDKHMTEYVEKWLKADGENTYFLVVGAGHMIGNTGIVQRLIDAGYTVNAVN